MFVHPDVMSLIVLTHALSTLLCIPSLQHAACCLLLCAMNTSGSLKSYILTDICQNTRPGTQAQGLGFKLQAHSLQTDWMSDI